jgi:hypothetical protein
MESYFVLGHVPITGEQYLLGPFNEQEAQHKVLELGDDEVGLIIKGVSIEPEDLF